MEGRKELGLICLRNLFEFSIGRLPLVQCRGSEEMSRD